MLAALGLLDLLGLSKLDAVTHQPTRRQLSALAFEERLEHLSRLREPACSHSAEAGRYLSCLSRPLPDGVMGMA